jgi:hypothetical protein
MQLVSIRMYNNVLASQGRRRVSDHTGSVAGSLPGASTSGWYCVRTRVQWTCQLFGHTTQPPPRARTCVATASIKQHCRKRLSRRNPTYVKQASSTCPASGMDTSRGIKNNNKINR